MFRTLLITLATMLVMLAPAQGQNKSIASQKSLIESIEREIKSGERAIAAIRKDKSTTEKKVRSIASQIEQRNRLLEVQRSQQKLLLEDIALADSASLALSEELLRECDLYGQMARESYRNYRHNNFISYIFAASDFNDIARRIVNIRRVAQMRQARIEVIDTLSRDLTAQREILSARKAELDSIVLGIGYQKQRLQSDINSARADIRTMSTKERKALEDNALQQQKLSVAIEELRRLSKGNSEGSSFTSKTSNLNLPVEGGRVKRYIDNMAEVVGRSGARVLSIYEGKVVDVKQNRITGKYDVYIAHGEYITSYAGLKSATVSKDSVVKRSQTIGEVGAAVDIITMATEYKIVFGIYPPSASQKMKAADCFKK